ncbi:hypothetical protein J6590_071571, partial [Homalodisca vitripennis]
EVDSPGCLCLSAFSSDVLLDHFFADKKQQFLTFYLNTSWEGALHCIRILT